MEKKYVYKIVQVGNEKVGKTQMINKFVNGETLVKPNSTVGIEFYLK